MVAILRVVAFTGFPLCSCLLSDQFARPAKAGDFAFQNLGVVRVRERLGEGWLSRVAKLLCPARLSRCERATPPEVFGSFGSPFFVLWERQSAWDLLALHTALPLSCFSELLSVILIALAGGCFAQSNWAQRQPSFTTLEQLPFPHGSWSWFRTALTCAASMRGTPGPLGHRAATKTPRDRAQLDWEGGWPLK